MKKSPLFSFHTTALLLLSLAAMCTSPAFLNAQIVYANIVINSQSYIYKIDLATCTFCPVTPASFNIGGFDIVLLSDGSVLNISGPNLVRTQPPPSTQIIWQMNTLPLGYLSGQLAPNGLVYLGGASGLGVFDPATNTVTYLGNWPAGFNGMYDIFYINGVLHGTLVEVSSNNDVLVQININNPSLSTIVGPLFPMGGAESGTWNGTPGIFYSDILFDLYFYDPITGNNTLICDSPAGLGIIGLTFPPPGLPEYPCLTICNTQAGTLPQAGPFDLCTNEILSFPAATQSSLEADDVLQYVLFTNPGDTAGSIVATSSSPSFTFAPPLQTGVTYYIAAVAGNELPNGNVDLNDPCLDFSNALQVVWQPLPTVVFTLANSAVCGGNCITIQANFTGAPPFMLEVVTPFTPLQTFTFPNNTGTFDVCPPPGTPPGNAVVQAVRLVDNNCTCE